jgi:hypothetical protein
MNSLRKTTLVLALGSSLALPACAEMEGVDEPTANGAVDEAPPELGDESLAEEVAADESALLAAATPSCDGWIPANGFDCPWGFTAHFDPTAGTLQCRKYVASDAYFPTCIPPYTQDEQPGTDRCEAFLLPSYNLQCNDGYHRVQTGSDSRDRCVRDAFYEYDEPNSCEAASKQKGIRCAAGDRTQFAAGKLYCNHDIAGAATDLPDCHDERIVQRGRDICPNETMQCLHTPVLGIYRRYQIDEIANQDRCVRITYVNPVAVP